MSRNFACFILSHGRPDNVRTYKALKAGGYTGKIYILCDNEDKTLDQYKSNYGDQVIVFNKTEYSKQVDACDNYNMRNSIVYARNYNFVLARKIGVTHFLQLDDDYTGFGWTLNHQDEYITSDTSTNMLDDVFNAFLDFLDCKNIETVAFAQGGDLIGGELGTYLQHHIQGKYRRKAMNSFFFKSSNDSVFRGRVNDDVNLYVEGGRKGKIYLTNMSFRLWQPETQKNSGGCTDVYLKLGTYIKSFYSVMVAPSCVKIAMMNSENQRIHHAVSWNNCCPVIIDEKYRKPR
jgi:hypothetical protein